MCKGEACVDCRSIEEEEEDGRGRGEKRSSHGRSDFRFGKPSRQHEIYEFTFTGFYDRATELLAWSMVDLP